jgi:O-Antigen ligase
MQGRKWLTRSVFFFLVVFVAAEPHSIAVAQIAYSGAVLFWLVNWILGTWRPVSQPLVLPSLVFIILSAVSAALSFVPSLSWAHLKSVALLLIFVLIAQNVNSFRQLKTLATVLVASCLINLAYTGWQYTVGEGVSLAPVTATSGLSQLGLDPGDIVQTFDGHRVWKPKDLLRDIAGLGPGSSARLSVLRGQPQYRENVEASVAALRNLGQEVAQGHVLMSRGRPIRAQGFYDHFVTYADVLVQIGLLAFAPFLVCPAKKYRQKILIGLVVFLIGAALWLTITRAAMVSFLVGCLLALWIVHGWKVSLLVLPLLAASVIVGSVLIHERGVTWTDLKSPEAQYRLLMWKDGLRLIRKHPVFGVGMDSIKVEWRRWNIQAYERFPLHGHFHSTPIQIAVERGLVTFVAWLWLLGAYFRVLWSNLRRARHAHWLARGLTIGCACAACGFLLGSLLDYSWGDSEVIMVFWTVMGFAIVLDRLLGAGDRPLETAPSG